MADVRDNMAAIIKPPVNQHGYWLRLNLYRPGVVVLHACCPGIVYFKPFQPHEATSSNSCHIIVLRVHGQAVGCKSVCIVNIAIFAANFPTIPTRILY